MYWIKDIQKNASREDHGKVRRLLDKYMQGDTTNEEETVLRDFFATHHGGLPEEWEAYVAMFGYVAAEKSAANALLHRRHWVLWVSAAASVLLLAGLAAVWQPHRSECYMVVNGKTITDRKEVRAEAMEALRMVGENYGEPFEAMTMMRQ